jgi:hypothetical protein
MYKYYSNNRKNPPLCASFATASLQRGCILLMGAAMVYGKNVKVRLLSGLALGSRLTAAA